jgi:hypothetical protein
VHSTVTSVVSALARAQAAHQRGAGLPAPAMRNLEQRLGARFVAELSSRLPAAELTDLGKITEVREAGLALARAGDLDAARARLRDAADKIEALASEEGRISGHSFQLAAKAFIEHKCGDHAAAVTSLDEALRLCRELRIRFGHSVEVRRIHLARNIARLFWVMGRPDESWVLLGRLARYAWGVAPAWPLEASTALEPEHRERLRREERMAVTDQILAEAINAAAEARVRRIALDASRWQPDESGALPGRVFTVAHTGEAISAGDTDAWLSSLAVYFEDGQGELPMTWRRAEQLLRDAASSG